MSRFPEEVLSRPLSGFVVGQRETLVCPVSIDDLDRFVELSGDRAPLHVDESFARARGYAGRVVHGAFLGALVSRLVGNRLPGALGVLQSMDLEFRRPVIAPTTLELSGEITGISAGTGQIAITVTIAGPTGEPHARARVRSIVRPEPLP